MEVKLRDEDRSAVSGGCNAGRGTSTGKSEDLQRGATERQHLAWPRSTQVRKVEQLRSLRLRAAARTGRQVCRANTVDSAAQRSLQAVHALNETICYQDSPPPSSMWHNLPARAVPQTRIQ